MNIALSILSLGIFPLGKFIYKAARQRRLDREAREDRKEREKAK